MHSTRTEYKPSLQAPQPHDSLSRLHWRLVALVFAGILVALFATMTNPARSASPPGDEAPIAYALKMAGDAKRMRIVMRLEKDPVLNWFLLRGPHRLVIDMPRMRFGFDPASMEPRGMVANVRYGQMDGEHSRVIIALNGPFEVERMRVSRNENTPGYRLIADIVSVSEKRFSALLADQMQTTGSTTAAKSDRLHGTTAKNRRPFTVVLDPGHGGIDGGARGVKGTVEKEITTKFADELKKYLESNENIKVFLTRNEDIFLRLDERVRIARQHEADLFVSIHADKVHQKYVRGATVYTLSEKASDAVASAIAESENRADAIAGIELEDDSPEVTDILLDLVHRETQTFSIRLARTLIGGLSQEVEMINNPHRSAGFRVLRAHDIPSVLVELGYLSNARDEELMNDPAWRAKVVAAISAALARYRDAVTAAGTR